jgi:hypothetical protein
LHRAKPSFQSFDDKKPARRWLGHVLNGRLDEHFERLCALSRQGAGVYVTINRTDLKGRKTENVVETRAVFVDLDGAPIANWKRLSLRPHIGVMSSPRRAHLYYRVTGIGLDESPEIQKRLAALMEGDPAICDLPRVMRLPGFPHQKGDPFMVEAEYTSGLPGAYTRGEFLKALDEAEEKRGAKEAVNNIVRAKAAEETGTSLPGLGKVPAYLKPLWPPGRKLMVDAGIVDAPPPYTPEWVEFVQGALAVIPADCTYEEWRNIGMALHWLGWGERGRDLFYAWSRTAKNSYSEAQWDAIWDGFGSYDGTPRTIASLIHEARERGYQAPSPAQPVANGHDASQDTPEARARASFEKQSAAKDTSKEGGVKLEDFYAYLPLHTYIYMPTREPWPAASVNSLIEPMPVIGANGKRVREEGGKPRMISASKWLDIHRGVEQMTWAPGEPEIIEGRLVNDGGWIDKEGSKVLNTYRAPLVARGDPRKATRWREHVERLYGDDAPHIIRFLAHRVQRPHEKINHALLLGGAQGIGKDTILEPVKIAIGSDNFQEVSPQRLLGRFNSFAKAVVLRISEARDLGEVNRYAFYEHMKTYTAAPPNVLRVEEKHLREQAVFNVVGVIITTNHKAGGIYLPSDDRRHFVAWSNLKVEDLPKGYFNEMWRWYAEGGIDHVVAYLQDLDLSAFDPKAPPPKTEAWHTIVNSSSPAEDADLADALDKLDNPIVTTLKEIIAAASGEFAMFLSEKKNRPASCIVSRAAVMPRSATRERRTGYGRSTALDKPSMRNRG